MRKRSKKFTYGGRAIPYSETIGFWENAVGSIALFCAVGGMCIAYAAVCIGSVVAVLFAGAWLYSKLGGV